MVDHTLWKAPYLSDHLMNTVSRSRLLTAIGEPLFARLTIITAPLGYGKTTLVAQWASRVTHPLCWMSAQDARDRGVSLTAWLDTVVAAWMASRGMIASPNSAVDDGVAPGSLASRMLGAVDGPITLVCDDVDAVPRHQIRLLLDQLLQHPATGNVHLIVMKRSRIGIIPGYLSAVGQVCELTADDLRFTVEGLDELALRLEIDLSAGDLTDIAATSEGWVAGALLLMQASGGHTRNGKVSFHLIDDFVQQNIFDHVPEAWRIPLLATVDLPVIRRAYLSVLLGTTTAPRMEDGYPFLLPVPGTADQLRHHPLVIASLRRLGDALDPVGARRKAIERLVRWLESVGEVDEARSIARHLQAWPLLIGVLADACREFALRDQHAEVITLLEGIPEAILLAHDDVGFWYLLAVLSIGDLVRGEPLLAQVALRWKDHPSLLLRGRYQVCHALASIFAGRREEALAAAQLSLTLLPESASLERFRASATSTVLGAHLGKPQLVQKMFAETRRYREALPWDQEWWNVFVLPDQADRLALSGDLDAATRLYEHQLRVFPDRFRGHAGLIKLRLALIAIEQGELDRARELMASDETASDEAYWAIGATLVRADLARFDGAPDRAEELVYAAISEAARRQGEIELHWARTALADMWIARGDLALARSWAESMPVGMNDWPRSFGQIMPQRTLALLKIRDGDLRGALALLDTLVTDGERRGHHGLLVGIHALRAAALHLMGRDEESNRARAYADELGSGGRFRWSLELGGFVTRDDDGRPNPIDIKIPVRLTRRELETLRYVDQGLTNGEIAARLFVSVFTVKNHLANVYEKLGVRGRVKAVQEARIRGLLR